jgi:hypothetical protein
VKAHPSEPAAVIFEPGELSDGQVVYHPRAMPCAEAFWEGGCKTRRQCIACRRWQCVDMLALLLCTECRRSCPCH